ncbi:ATP-binding protein [Methanolobus mangrovi]|uniref:ATP-binding protein n=1 Tax=Methanolobus mangrovi TaxID=3072977 RepID=A0AA51YI17_9EURY|nr:ATP-binding protein [Methanolobus mangrovi]WMW21125.1 ATP-binding protein [Methanolobus mangrovi]
MVHDNYLITHECIRKEVEYVLSEDMQFKGIKPVYFSSSQDVRNSEVILDIIREQKCDNDILLLCDRSCPKVSIPDEYSGSVNVHKVEHMYDLFTENLVLQEYEGTGSFIIVSGWLENWQDNIKSVAQYDNNSVFSFSESYSSILILDTGVHSDLIVRAKELSEFTGIPFKIHDVGMEYFNLIFENLVLRWNIEKKQSQLKICNRKAASYAMSIDFIKTIADITDESVAIDSICKLFSTMFAPKNIVYYSFNEDGMELKYCKLPGTEQENTIKLKNSDSNYIVFDTEDGFAIKIMATADVLGIIEIHGVAFPEYLDEYLSAGYDLAKGSGLAISNIRRYHELFRSREEQVKLAEMLRTTNRILRHDIANDLQIIIGALDIFEENGDEKFLSMVKQASQKSVALIRNLKEIEEVSAGDKQFELLNVKSLVDGVISKHTAEFNVRGDCVIMADKAMSSVLDNIVSNAIIHGNATKVDIGIVSQNGTCEISIADNGTGIPDEVKSRAFDEGYKYGKTGHTGFGLYIARKTIERYGGTVQVEDNKPTGAKFVIELNAARMDNYVAN